MPRRKQICPQRLDADEVKSEGQGSGNQPGKREDASAGGNTEDEAKDPDDLKDGCPKGQKAKGQTRVGETRSISPDRRIHGCAAESVIRPVAGRRVKSEAASVGNQSRLPASLSLTESVIKMAREQSFESSLKSCIVENKSAEKRKVRETSGKMDLSKAVLLQTSIQDFPTWHRKGKPMKGQESVTMRCTRYEDAPATTDDQPLDLSRKPKKLKKTRSESQSSVKKSPVLDGNDLSSSLQSLQQKFGGDFPFTSARRPRIGLTEQYYMSHLHVSPSSFSGWRKSSSRVQPKEFRQEEQAEVKNGHCFEEHTTQSESPIKSETAVRNSQTVNAILTKISGSSDSEKADTCTNKHTTHRCSCQKSFATLYELSIHLQESGHSPGIGKQTNLMEYPKLVRGQDMWLNQGSEQTKQILRCIQCGESFKSLPELTVHMMETQHYTKIVSTEHGRRAHKCSAYCERESADSECVFKCKICHKVFPDMEALANHMVISGHHRKQTVRVCKSSVTEPSANRQFRKRLLEESSEELTKASHSDNKKTFLMPHHCGGVVRDSYRAQSPLYKTGKTNVSHSDKKIACENCGDKIEMDQFVEHIRFCLRKRVDEIHHLRLSRLTSPCAGEASKFSLRDILAKSKSALRDNEAESSVSKHRKLNSVHKWKTCNGDTQSHHRSSRCHSTSLNPCLPSEKYRQAKSHSAPNSPCNLVLAESPCSSRLPDPSHLTSEHRCITETAECRSASPQLSSPSLPSQRRGSRSSSDSSEPRLHGRSSPSLYRDKRHCDKDGMCCDRELERRPDSVPKLGDHDRLLHSPVSDQGCGTAPHSPADSRSRSCSPASPGKMSCHTPNMNGFTSDLSRSSSPIGLYRATPPTPKPHGSPAQQLVKVEESLAFTEESTKPVDIGLRSTPFEDRPPSAIEQMIREYSKTTLPDSVSHLKKLSEMKLPTCDHRGVGFQKPTPNRDGEGKGKESGPPSQPLDIIDPDSSDTSSPATNALKAMENLIQKSFESKSEKAPKKLCPIDMLRQPLYGWFYQREKCSKVYPSSQVLKKDAGHLGMVQKEKPRPENGDKLPAGHQANGLEKSHDVSMEPKSPGLKVSPSEGPVKRESVVCKYLNFFDDTSPENGKSKASALDSLSSFVYGQPLTSEHPLDSLQRLISKAETPHEPYAGGGLSKLPVSTPEPAGGSSSPAGEDLPLNLTIKCQAIKTEEEHCPASSQPSEAEPKSDDCPSGNSDGESVEYKCPACNRHFATKGSYRYHLSRCHLSTVKKYGISTAFHMSPYIYLPLDHTAKFTKYYEMAQELAGKELANENEEK